MSANKPVAFSDHDVRVRAFKMWEEQGRPEGNADQFWREALAALEAECKAVKSAGRNSPRRKDVSTN